MEKKSPKYQQEVGPKKGEEEFEISSKTSVAVMDLAYTPPGRGGGGGIDLTDPAQVKPAFIHPSLNLTASNLHQI